MKQIPIAQKKYIKHLAGSLIFFFLGFSATVIVSILGIFNSSVIEFPAIAMTVVFMLITVFGVFMVSDILRKRKDKNTGFVIFDKGIIDNTSLFKYGRTIYYNDIKDVMFLKSDKGVTYYTISLLPTVDSLKKRKTHKILLTDRLILKTELEEIIEKIKSNISKLKKIENST